MRYFSSVIYTLIVCNFIMAMCRRLAMTKSDGMPRYLLISYLDTRNVAFLFGYADNQAKLLSLQHKMYMDGFVDKMQVPLKIVQPLGKRRYRSIESGICFLPYTLLHTCSSIWFPTVRKYGITKEILMSIVNEENNG